MQNGNIGVPLLQLPAEIVLMILSHLSRKEISAITKVSKLLRKICEPSFYHDIQFDWFQPPLTRLLQLLRTLRDRNELARHVRRFELITYISDNWRLINCGLARREVTANGITRFKGWWDDKSWSEQYKIPMEYAMGIVKSAKFPNVGRWKAFLRTGNPYAYATVLLSQFRNLRYLHLDVSFTLFGDLPGLMLKHALLTPPSGWISMFPKLEEVSYGTTAIDFQRNHGSAWTAANRLQKIHIDSANFGAWFFLPSMSSLEIYTGEHIPTLNIFKYTYEKLALKVAKIRRFTINGAVLTRSSTIGDILRRMTSLEELHIISAYDDEAWPNKENIISALSAIKPTLRKFTLELVFAIYENHLYLDDRQVAKYEDTMRLPRSFFKDSKLTSISIPYHCLVKSKADEAGLVESLPPCIEEISLDCRYRDGTTPRNQGTEIIHSISSLLQNNRSDFPALRRICVFICPAKDGTYYQHMNPRVELRSLGREVNVLIEFRRGNGGILPDN